MAGRGLQTPPERGILGLQRLHTSGVVSRGLTPAQPAKLRLCLKRPAAKASEFIPEVTDQNFELPERRTVMPFVVGHQDESPRRAIAYPAELQPLSREECARDAGTSTAT
jgi:hypothetical protein